jgi:uncharacterized protein DUF4260
MEQHKRGCPQVRGSREWVFVRGVEVSLLRPGKARTCPLFAPPATREIFLHSNPALSHQNSMATASDVRTPPPKVPAQLPVPVRYILRFEGLAIAIVSAVLYARTGASWWLFAGLWLAPDLSMLGYLLSPCRGARIYNAFHTYTVPIVLGLMGALFHARGLMPFALIWINHIGVDRVLGYGLKYSNGFGWTHLGIKSKTGA